MCQGAMNRQWLVALPARHQKQLFRSPARKQDRGKCYADSSSLERPSAKITGVTSEYRIIKRQLHQRIGTAAIFRWLTSCGKNLLIANHRCVA